MAPKSLAVIGPRRHPSPMRRPPGPEPPVVFDCDGVLLDTEAAWTRAETTLFARYGRSYGPEEKRMLIGGSLAETGQALERLMAGRRTASQLADELIELAAEEFERGVKPMPGALGLLEELRNRPIAVASNSERRLVDLALHGSGLTDAFAAVIAGDEIPSPKPAPDIYLEACRRLGVEPGSAVAIEDSPTGAAAARAAGMFVIGIPYFHDLTFEANLTGRSLADPPVRAALGLAI
jgi:HAD superfamily hydrolase (TIGR01509 family)